MWFSNKKKRDAFEQREQQQKVWRLVRRLIDIHAPNTRSEDASNRSWQRSSRCVPVAFVPVTGEDLDPARLLFASTKEFSENGLSLITTERVEFTECVCSIWLDEPKLISGIVRRVKPFGGNMIEVGIELLEIIESTEMLHQLGDKLNALSPIHSAAAESPTDLEQYANVVHS